MAEMMGMMVRDAATVAALSSAVAGSAVTRRNRQAYYDNQGAKASGNYGSSYRNHMLRSPRSRMTPNHGPGPGVGIHIQCQDPYLQGSRYPGEMITSSNYGYGYGHGSGGSWIAHNPQYFPSSMVSPGSLCGCPQCYWREFYYVGRVREVYDSHNEHHRLLFRKTCLPWETPKKIILSEEEGGEEAEQQEAAQAGPSYSSRALTPQSRPRSGALRRCNSDSMLGMPPLSRAPTPLLRNNESQISVAVGPTWEEKGKEVDRTGLGGDGDAPYESTSSHTTDEDAQRIGSPVPVPVPMSEPEPKLEPEPSEPNIRPQLKSSKSSLHQRLRQLWSPKTRSNSSDKAELVHYA
ncbi:hypothetical protein F5Y08DRAFT_352144 [Xylaria arbuscula]|nr:hypothetical protein F5Y08DRAFT_352144 [Xylaria arbuscula]